MRRLLGIAVLVVMVFALGGLSGWMVADERWSRRQREVEREIAIRNLGELNRVERVSEE